MVSFASMLGESLAQAETLSGNAAVTPDTARPWMLKDTNFKPKAKHVIFLFMNGGISQVDSFDPKPTLTKFDGKPMPDAEPARLWRYYKPSGLVTTARDDSLLIRLT